LVSNKVYLQIVEEVDITAETRRSAEVRREKRQNPIICKGKDKNRKKDLYMKWLCHLCVSAVKAGMIFGKRLQKICFYRIKVSFNCKANLLQHGGAL
jgi:hypothetical protein